MCCRNEDHSKAVLILGLWALGARSGLVDEHCVAWAGRGVPGSRSAGKPSRSALMSQHLIRLRKGWELIDLDSPDLRPAPITLPLPAGWGAARRLRLTRRFGCPPLSLQSESLWLRLESVPGLASLQLNGHDLPLGPYFQGTIDIRLADLPARNELALELSGGASLGAPPGDRVAWGEIALLIRSEHG